MAQTDLRKRSVQEKMNSMDIDLITMDMTTDAETIADNYLISQPIEIPNAVAVEGGSAIIQSLIISNLDNSTESPAMEVVFTSADTAMAGDEGAVINAADGTVEKMLGTIVVSNWSVMAPSTNEIATKTNVGLVIKANSGTRSIYAALINRSGGDYTPSGSGVIQMKVGIVKD